VEEKEEGKSREEARYKKEQLVTEEKCNEKTSV
jgi:hypothetical protein